MKANAFVKLMTNPAISYAMPEGSSALAGDVPADLDLSKVVLYKKIHNSTVFDGGYQFTVLEIWYRTEDTKEEGLLGTIFFKNADEFEEAERFAHTFIAYSGTQRDKVYVVYELTEETKKFNLLGCFRDYATAKLKAQNTSERSICIEEGHKVKEYDIYNTEEIEKTDDRDEIYAVKVTGYRTEKDHRTETRRYYLTDMTIQ